MLKSLLFVLSLGLAKVNFASYCEKQAQFDEVTPVIIAFSYNLIEDSVSIDNAYQDILNAIKIFESFGMTKKPIIIRDLDILLGLYDQNSTHSFVDKYENLLEKYSDTKLSYDGCIELYSKPTTYPFVAQKNNISEDKAKFLCLYKEVQWLKPPIIKPSEVISKLLPPQASKLAVYYTGHGMDLDDELEERINQFRVLLPANQKEISDFILDFDEIFKNKTTALFVVDACFSGLCLQGEDQSKDLKVKESQIVFASSLEGQISHDNDGSNRGLSFLLAEILKKDKSNLSCEFDFDGDQYLSSSEFNILIKSLQLSSIEGSDQIVKEIGNNPYKKLGLRSVNPTRDEWSRKSLQLPFVRTKKNQCVLDLSFCDNSLHERPELSLRENIYSAIVSVAQKTNEANGRNFSHFRELVGANQLALVTNVDSIKGYISPVTSEIIDWIDLISPDFELTKDESFEIKDSFEKLFRIHPYQVD